MLVVMLLNLDVREARDSRMPAPSRFRQHMMYTSSMTKNATAIMGKTPIQIALKIWYDDMINKMGFFDLAFFGCYSTGFIYNGFSTKH